MIQDKFKIIELIDINHNMYLITIESPVDLPPIRISYHIYIYNADDYCRPYSPLFIKDNKMVLAIKKYDGGRISEYLYNKKVGELVKIGYFIEAREYKRNEHKEVLMICGGTGITPMYQILINELGDDFNNKKTNKTTNKTDNMVSSFNNKTGSFNNNSTNFTLLWANKTSNDTFLLSELNKFEKTGRLKLINIFTQENNKNEDNIMNSKLSDDTDNSKTNNNLTNTNSFTMISKKVRELVNNNKYDNFYICGPPGFMKNICGTKTKDKKQGELTGFMKELGFTEKDVHKF